MARLAKRASGLSTIAGERMHAAQTVLTRNQDLPDGRHQHSKKAHAHGTEDTVGLPGCQWNPTWCPHDVSRALGTPASRVRAPQVETRLLTLAVRAWRFSEHHVVVIDHTNDQI